LAGRYPDRVSSVLENIAWDFLERTEAELASSTSGGFAWGSLILPNGTELRVRKSHSFDYGYAEVKDHKIMYDGEAVRSPSQFASRVRRNTSVNAWDYVEIKRPHDRDWKLANSFRK
jgi:hypothetical protein